jgi:hypothetical protein
MQPVSGKWIGKHIPIAKNAHKTTELLLETVFYILSVQSGYNEDNWGELCGGGVEYLNLRVAGGDEKGAECLGL